MIYVHVMCVVQYLPVYTKVEEVHIIPETDYIHVHTYMNTYIHIYNIHICGHI